MPHKPPEKGECLPPHEPNDLTRRMVVMCATNGFSHKRIAGMLDVCEDTLRKHYRWELDHGKDKMVVDTTQRLAQKYIFNDELYEKDPKTGLQAMTLFLNSKAGWKQESSVDLNSGAGMKLNISFDDKPSHDTV